MSERSLKLFFSPAYVAAPCNFDTVRKAGWIAESLQQRPIPGVCLEPPAPLTVEDLSEIHDSVYANALRTGEPRVLAESSGLEWDSGLWTSVAASNGGIVAAALHALATGRNSGSFSAGIHHARRDRGMAFCSLNGLALAARAALQAGARRILIADFDAHCGGGTYSLVRDWPEVHHLDIATSDFDRYEPNGTNATLDIVTDASTYLPTLVAARLAPLDGEAFDLVLLGAGVDCHEGNGGPWGITFEFLAHREATIFSWAAARRVPVAFCLLGGYRSTDLEEEAVSRLHRVAIAAAAIANRGDLLDSQRIMELASTQDGIEGFSFDSTGRRYDAKSWDESP